MFYNMFAGLRIHVQSGGPHLSKSRASLLHKSIKNHGGDVVDVPEDADVVVSDTPVSCDVVSVSPDWVSKSILQRQRLQFDQFVNDKHEDEISSPILKRQKVEAPIEKVESVEALPTGPSQASFVENAVIADSIAELGQKYKDIGDQWRSLTYSKACAIIRSLPFPLNSDEAVDRVSGIRGIGSGVLEKIREIVNTGTSRRLELLRKSSRVSTMELFSKIHGVGAHTAKDWFDIGLRSIEDLRSKPDDFFTHSQLIGLKYYEEFLEKIPREEVHKIFSHVKDVGVTIDPELRFELVGSYRRGKPFCGDVDILLTQSDAALDDSSLHGVLGRVVEELAEEGFITDTIALSHDTNKLKQSFMGVCKLESGNHRRIDIKVYPRESFAYALLYFTGNVFVNRSMRLQAKKLGLFLDDSGLHQVHRVNGKRIAQGISIPCESEQDIFQALGLAYIAPEDRNIFDVWTSNLDTKSESSEIS